MENFNNNMDLLNTEKLEDNFSNFSLRDKFKANRETLEAQIEAAKSNKDLVLTQQKTQELQVDKTKSEEDAAKSIDEARANANIRTASSDSSDNDKILGLPKVAFWIGLSVVLLGAGFATYKIIKNRNK